MKQSVLSLRDREERICQYVYLSALYYRKHLECYNSTDPVDYTLSFTHLYKAWDSLFQANLLGAGFKIRKPDGRFVLGTITGITDTLINYLIKKREGREEGGTVEKWKLTHRFSYWPSENFKSMVDNFSTSPLLPTLDLLREIRNADAHDFIVNTSFSYLENVRLTNPYVQSLQSDWLNFYEELVDYCMANCKKRSQFCNSKKLESVESLQAITRVPSIDRDTKPSGDSTISRFLKDRIRNYHETHKIPRQRSQLAVTPEDLLIKYYDSLTQLAKECGLLPSAHRRVKALLQRHSLEPGQVVVIQYRGVDRTFYSKDLVSLIEKHGKGAKFKRLECCYQQD